MSAAPVLLLAASGLAREVIAAIRSRDPGRSIAILDDNPALWGETIDGALVLGGLSEVVSHPDHRLIICVGHGLSRQRIVERLTGLGVRPDRFTTIVHPSAQIAPGTVIGRGTIVLAGVVMTAAVELGEHVVVMPNVTLTHDNRIASFATICANVALGGAVTLGTRSYLGMSASVRQNVQIGDDVTVGMGAVVLHHVPEGETWIGIPASARHGGE